MSKVEKAIMFATIAHEGQYRKHYGVPYIVHPLEVLKQIKIWEVGDIEMQIDCAAVLHDVIEDSHYTKADIEKEFGSIVANYVEDLTFTHELGTKERYLSSFSDKAWQSHVIKIADRLCNVRDFILTDEKYALKYLLKAEFLINSFGRRNDIDRKLERAIHNDTSVLLGYLNGK